MSLNNNEKDEYLDLSDLLDTSNISLEDVNSQAGETNDQDIGRIKDVYSDERVKICYSELDLEAQKKLKAYEARIEKIENFRRKYFLRQPLFELCENEIKFFLDMYNPPLPVKKKRRLFPFKPYIYLPINLEGIGFYDRKQWLKAQVPLNKEEFTEYAYYHPREEFDVVGSSSTYRSTSSPTPPSPICHEEMGAEIVEDEAGIFETEKYSFDYSHNDITLSKEELKDFGPLAGELGEFDGSERIPILNPEIRYGSRKFLTGHEQWVLDDIRMQMIYHYSQNDEKLFFMKFILENDPSLDPKTKFEVEKAIKGLEPMMHLRKPGQYEELQSYSLDKILFYNPTAFSGSSQRNVGLLEHRRIIAKYPCPRVEAPEKFVTWMEPMCFEKGADTEFEWLDDPPSDTEIDYVVELNQRRLWKEIKWQYEPGGDTRTIPVPRVYTTPRLARYILSNPTIPYTSTYFNFILLEICFFLLI